MSRNKKLATLCVMLLVFSAAAWAQSNSSAGGASQEGVGGNAGSQAAQPSANASNAPNAEGLIADRLAARWRQIEKRLGVTDAEVRKIETAVGPFNEEIRQASADIAVTRAQLARELINDKPDMDKVRSLVKKSLDQELAVRMAEIQRQLAIRDIVGSSRWTTLSAAVRELRGGINSIRSRLSGLKLFALLDEIQPRN